ncbi:hypothetical protein G9444_0623 [Rhodococcus erythropolis]|uniref:Uncharacterized protein n=1 Tax=Rhodococcus erythropolis TaxID=1833 RepID=A0A6G9CLI0_RHOER|nr:hypothetical protein G9444_0623 [Rhodococcus erythropolis]
MKYQTDEQLSLRLVPPKLMRVVGIEASRLLGWIIGQAADRPVRICINTFSPDAQ